MVAVPVSCPVSPRVVLKKERYRLAANEHGQNVGRASDCHWIRKKAPYISCGKTTVKPMVSCGCSSTNPLKNRILGRLFLDPRSSGIDAVFGSQKMKASRGISTYQTILNHPKLYQTIPNHRKKKTYWTSGWIFVGLWSTSHTSPTSPWFQSQRQEDTNAWLARSGDEQPTRNRKTVGSLGGFRPRELPLQSTWSHQNMGGFHKWGYPYKSSISRWDCP